MRDIYHFDDNGFSALPVSVYSPACREKRTPIIIDNGSHTCKCGWATDDKPRLKFRNLIARPKGRKELETTGHQIGNDITNLDSLKWGVRTQFDANIVTYFDAQEHILDYTFAQMGLSDETSVDHPLVVTEALCNPLCCRQRFSELLFECYNVPSVAYGTDCLFSLDKNIPSVTDALVVSVGYQTTHIVPFLSGKIVPQHCRRINIGGSTAMGFMHRTLQLKYPNHAADITLSRAQELVEKHTYMAKDFAEKMRAWRTDEYRQEHGRTLQLPYKDIMNSSAKDQEKDKERRLRQGQRLQDLNAKRRDEKVTRDAAKLQALSAGLERISTDARTTKSQLKKFEMTSVKELQDAVESLTASLSQRHTKHQSTSQNDSEIGVVKVDNEDSRNSSLLEPLSDMEMEEWLNGLRTERQELLEARRKRLQRRQELGVRKSHAFKERMRILSKLAHDGNSSKSQKKTKEDTFGMNDKDWEVYKYISREESDSDGEQERLVELENILSQNDSQFTPRLTSDSSETDWSLYYQLQLTTERVRVPEIFYQPSILGLDQAGIAETIDFVLKKFSPSDQEKLVKNVFVTGGSSSFPGFADRLRSELLAIRPFQSHFNVICAEDPILDAWGGARLFAMDASSLARDSISRADYDEFGGEYLKEHRASNLFVTAAAREDKAVV